MIPSDQGKALEDLWVRRRSSGEPVEFTIDVKASDGRVVRHDVSAAPLRDGTTVIGFFGVAAAARPRRPLVLRDRRLTKRQLEVLQLLAEGKSTSEIADQLYLSKTTVRNHIAHLLANLGVHTRIEAIVVAQRAGLIQMD